ncbi:FecR family protein [Chitinophaga arvensicola]|nr:FecR family protein [Chitinophaga arvensicola]
MKHEYYEKLVRGYVNKTLTEDELLVFTRLMQEGELDTYLEAAMNEAAGINGAEMPEEQPLPRRRLPLWWAAAAAIAGMIALVYFLRPVVSTSPGMANTLPHDLPPGGQQAILTLQDNSQVVLQPGKAGIISRQGQTLVLQQQPGQLQYQTDGGKDTSVWNTLTTPPGGQYQLVLSDGTQVWLNAASSISFPVAFPPGKREIRITGEVYLEVTTAGTKATPFLVKTPGQQVIVLGTHFNINSYSNEPSEKVTLLQGAVQVTNPGTRVPIQLRPGEQSVSKRGQAIRVQEVDTETVIDWKEGYFIFNDEDLESIMRKVARWYNVKVEYQCNPANLSFGGMVSRGKNLSAVLKIMESAGSVHFRIIDQKVIVMP